MGGFFLNYSDIKFHENPSRGSGAVPCGRTDGQMRKLIVASRNFPNALKNCKANTINSKALFAVQNPSLTQNRLKYSRNVGGDEDRGYTNCNLPGNQVTKWGKTGFTHPLIHIHHFYTPCNPFLIYPLEPSRQNNR